MINDLDHEFNVAELEHEDHETLVADCLFCAQLVDEAAREFMNGPVYSKAELAELEADRELMRDEFHR